MIEGPQNDQSLIQTVISPQKTFELRAGVQVQLIYQPKKPEENLRERELLRQKRQEASRVFKLPLPDGQEITLQGKRKADCLAGLLQASENHPVFEDELARSIYGECNHKTVKSVVEQIRVLPPILAPFGWEIIQTSQRGRSFPVGYYLKKSPESKVLKKQEAGYQVKTLVEVNQESLKVGLKQIAPFCHNHQLETTNPSRLGKITGWAPDVWAQILYIGHSLLSKSKSPLPYPRFCQELDTDELSFYALGQSLVRVKSLFTKVQDLTSYFLSLPSLVQMDNQERERWLNWFGEKQTLQKETPA